MNNYTDRLQRDADHWGNGPNNWYPEYQAKCKELSEAKDEIKRLSTPPATQGEDNPVINSLVDLNMPGLGWGEDKCIKCGI